MVMVSRFSNFPDELSENDELREYELSGSDCMRNAQVNACQDPLILPSPWGNFLSG